MTFEFNRSVVCPEDVKFKKDFDAQLLEFQPYYQAKFDVCERIGPNRIAEIGIRAGYSAWAFLQSAPQAEYIGYDINNGTHGGLGGENGVYMKWARQILTPYKATLIEMDSQSIDDLGITGIDLFHVDGEHSYEATSHDLELALKAVTPNGYILVDDTENRSIPSVRKAVEDWLNFHNYSATWQNMAGIGQCLIHVMESQT